MSRTPRTDVGPSTHIHTGPTVPAWTLHAGLAVAAAGAVCAAAAGTTLDTSSLLLLLAGLLLAIAHAARRPTLVRQSPHSSRQASPASSSCRPPTRGASP